MKRLAWLDVARGLAILLVVYFHFFMTYIDGRPAPLWDWQTMSGSAGALAEAIWLKLSGLGFHAVGLFIALSGWALMESTSRRAAKGPIKWGSWYV
ncbi:MAG: acyltransferase family protein, partial [Chthoniobacterales bacterium]